MAPVEYLGAWGTLIHEKNLNRKSRVRLTLTLYVPEKKRRDVEILGWWVEPRLLRFLGAGQREGGGGVGLLLLHYSITVAGVFDEPFSQLTPLSGVVVQGRQST
jgi:hypothetical protein